MGRLFILSFFIFVLPCSKCYSQHDYLVEITHFEIYRPQSLKKSKIAGTISEIVSNPAMSKENPKFDLEPGECFDDLCFVRVQILPSNKLVADLQYQFGTATKTLHISSNTSFRATLRPLVANLKNPLEVIEQFHRLFPDNQWMGGQSLVFFDGRWTDRNLVMMPFSGQKDWDIPELLQKIESVTVDRSGGLPVLNAESYKDCRTFRLSLVGIEALPKFAQASTDLAPQIPYFERMVRIRCKTPDGKIGYCSSPPEDYDPSLGFSSECIPEEKSAELTSKSAVSVNSCGGPKVENYLEYKRIWSSWHESSLTRPLITKALGKDGKSCSDPDGLDLLVAFEETENFERKTIALKMPASTDAGHCLNGRCLSKDFNFCALKATHLELSIAQSILEGWWGAERAEKFRSEHIVSQSNEADLKQRLNSTNDRLPFLQEIAGAENVPDGTACPGGICEGGQCRSWEEISSRYDRVVANPSTQCDLKIDGDSCITDSQKLGNCFLSQCLQCKIYESNGEWIEELIGALQCPLKANLFPKSKNPRRKSCTQPRVCSYH